MLEDEPLAFANEAEPPPSRASGAWKIIVADDEPNVHLVTRLALGGVEFEGKPLQLLSAYSEADVRALLAEHPDTALILLDVVMESNDSGIAIVRYIREVLKNKNLRIILRTGHPGSASEEKVVIDYDINDFKDKTELTVAKLRTSVIVSLRSFHHLTLLENSRHYLQQVIDSVDSLLLTVDAHLRVKSFNSHAGRLFDLNPQVDHLKPLAQVHPWFENLLDMVRGVFQSQSVSKFFKVPFLEEGKRLVDITLTPIALQDGLEVLMRLDDVTDVLSQEYQIGLLEKFNLVGAFQLAWEERLRSIYDRLRSLVTRSSTQADGGKTQSPELEALLEEMEDLVTPSVSLRGPALPAFRPLSLNRLLQEIHLRTPVFSLKVLPDSEIWVQGAEKLLNQALSTLFRRVFHLETVSVTLGRAMGATKERFTSPLRQRSLARIDVIGRASGRWPLSLTEGSEASWEADSDFLALSAVVHIVQLHSGFVEFAHPSEDLSGLALYLPETTSREGATALPETQDRGLILVCDDESLMLRVTGNILKQLGFRVIYASEGNEAVKLAQRHRHELKLVILDLLLPGMEGYRVFEILRAISPDLPVLFSSGYGKTEKVQLAMAQRRVGFLSKPFGIQDLAKEVFDLLGPDEN